MSSLFTRILSLLLVYRYVVLFAVTFLSSFGLPVQSGPSTIAAAAFAGQGYFNIFWVIVFGSAGNIGGDFALYWLVRRYGRKALYRLGLRRLADSPALLNAEATVETYKTPMLIASRFQIQATAIVNLIAGLAKMVVTGNQVSGVVIVIGPTGLLHLTRKDLILRPTSCCTPMLKFWVKHGLAVSLASRSCPHK